MSTRLASICLLDHAVKISLHLLTVYQIDFHESECYVHCAQNLFQGKAQASDRLRDQLPHKNLKLLQLLS